MNLKQVLSSLIAGPAVALFVSQIILHGTVYGLIPWALVGLGVGALFVQFRWALLGGGLYGFVLAFTFMMIGYTGSEPVVKYLPPFVLLGLFGAACGALWALLGCLLRIKAFKRGAK